MAAEDLALLRFSCGCSFRPSLKRGQFRLFLCEKSKDGSSFGLIFFLRQQIAEVLDIEAGNVLIHSQHSAAPGNIQFPG
jgi:hypothetical protein